MAETGWMWCVVFLIRSTAVCASVHVQVPRAMGPAMHLGQLAPDVAAAHWSTLGDDEAHSVRTEAKDTCLYVPGQSGHHS